MKDLLSNVLRATWTSCTLIQDIVDNLSHALLVGFKYLNLLLHQPCLLEQQTLRYSVATRASLELYAHLIQEGIHFLVSDGLDLSPMILGHLFRR